MSPTEARRLVGQPDIVERLRVPAALSMYASSADLLAELARQRAAAADEIDRLRTALRAVRASTDPKWQAQIISDALREGE